jgi:alpha-glucoside transport system substrate-binding protein
MAQRRKERSEMSRQRMSQVIIILMLVASFIVGCSAPATPFPPAGSSSAPSSLDEALAGKYKGTTVTIGNPWDGRFAVAYEESLRDFEEKTGINLKIQWIDEGDPNFIAAVNVGGGPDVAVLHPNAIWQFAKSGKVIDLTKIVDREMLRTRYDQNWLDWATMTGPNGPIITGIWGPIYIRNVIWYPKAAFDLAGYKVPTTWQELLDLSDQIVKDGGTPWCIEDGFRGGWTVGLPAAIWIADAFLRTAPADHDKWMKGELKFNSPQVKQAVQMMSDIWLKPGYVYGGRQALNATYQWGVADPMFYPDPKCWLLEDLSTITEIDGEGTSTTFSNRAYGKDYAFFLPPPADASHGIPVQVSGLVTTMFHDRPEARALMEYLTTGAQLENWIKSNINDGFSPHKEANPEWFSSARERALAEVIVDAQKTGNLYNPDGYWQWLRPDVAFQALKSYSGYVNGDVDLDTALNQIDAAAAAGATP